MRLIGQWPEAVSATPLFLFPLTKLLKKSTTKYLITKRNTVQWLTVQWLMRRENNRWLGWKRIVLSMEDKMTAGTCALGIMGEALEDPQLISEQS